MRVKMAMIGAVAAMLAAVGTLTAQIVPVRPVVAGVSISPDGVISVTEGGARPAPKGAAKDATLTYISLPRVFAELKKAHEAGKEVPADVRYLGGLIGIDHLYVYPAEHDIVIAGHGEPVDASNPLSPIGTVTGHPIMQLDDLIVAIRMENRGGGKEFFGCSLDVPANYKEIEKGIIAKFEKGPRDRLLAELKKGMPSQIVKLFGVPEDSRVAMSMLAADYKLKRLSMGLENFGVPGMSNAVSAEASSSRLWFEPSYEPLKVSSDGTAYEIRGARLKILAGATAFKSEGASEAAKKFAESFSAKMGDIAKKVEAVADLQNVADEFLVGSLIKHDGLADKAGVDLSWVLGESNYKPAALPVPKTAETQFHIIGQQLACGGVAMRYDAVIKAARETDAGVAGSAKRPEGDSWKLQESEK